MRNDIAHNAAPHKVPGWLLGLIVLFVVLSWVPLAWIAHSRTMKSEKSPVHLFLDMDFQPRFGPQELQSDAVAQYFPGEPIRFDDGRSMRDPIPGTIAFDTLDEEFDPEDDHFYRGYESDLDLQPILVDQQPKYLDGYPEGLTIDREFILRGRERFNIYCAVCHGNAGFGDGPVNQRVLELQAQYPAAIAGWIPPRNLHDAAAMQFSPAKIFDTITRGKGAKDESTGKMTYTMWPYASQIPPRDRWAIAAYVKVLQKSQFYPIDELEGELQSQVQASEPIERPGLTKELQVAAEGGIVLEEAPFTEEELDDPQLVEQGKLLFLTKICNTCHQVDPAIVAPAGLGLRAPKFMGNFWGKQVKVHKGIGPDGMGSPDMATVTMNVDYFYHSVKEPMALISEGAIPGMAPLPTTDEEIKALAAYVKSLSKD